MVFLFISIKTAFLQEAFKFANSNWWIFGIWNRDPLHAARVASTWAGLWEIRHPGTFWLNWQKGEKIQVEARVFEWTSARNSILPSERAKKSWCQWIKKAIQIQDSEEEYVEKTRVAKEVIITLPLPAWTMWTSSPRWISRVKVSLSCWSYETKWGPPIFWGSWWPSAAWLHPAELLKNVWKLKASSPIMSNQNHRKVCSKKAYSPGFGLVFSCCFGFFVWMIFFCNYFF